MLSAFYNMSTRAKLLSSFVVVILLNLFVTVTSISSIMKAQEGAAIIEGVAQRSMGRAIGFQEKMIEGNAFWLAGLNLQNKSVSISEFKRRAKDYITNFHDVVRSFGAESINQDILKAMPEYGKLADRIRADAQRAADSMEKLLPEIALLMGEDSRDQIELLLGKYLIEAYPHASAAISTCTAILGMQANFNAQMALQNTDPKMVYTSLVLAVISVVLALFLAIFIAGYISRNPQEQIVCLRALSEGNFTQKLPDTYKDEFGESMKMLGNMRSAIERIIKMTKDACDKLQNEMRNLQQVSHEITSTSHDVQNQAVTVAAASDQMVSTTADIAKNCESAANGAGECQSMTQESFDKVQQAVDNIRTQSEHTRDNANKIESLARQSNKIGSIVSTIDEIAAQTNLLALNAAIEAARAGEAGRGFAVVADEVRALASRTTASTKEISAMVRTIQDDAAAATESITTSVTNMDTIAEDAQGILTLLTDVTSHVSQVTGQITHIATSAEEQTSATAEISSNMQRVSTATTNMSEDAQNQYASMEQAYSDLQRLREALDFFKTA